MSAAAVAFLQTQPLVPKIARSAVPCVSVAFQFTSRTTL